MTNQVPSPTLPTCNFPSVDLQIPDPTGLISLIIAALKALGFTLPTPPTVPLPSLPCPFSG